MRPAANAAYLPECVKHSGRWYEHAPLEFLDAFYLAPPARRQAMIDVEPPAWSDPVRQA